jgi:hypothetical protein
MTVALAAGSTTPANEPSHDAPEPSGTPVVESFITEDLEDINAAIEKAAEADEDWVLDPIRIAMNVVEQGPDALEERRYLNLTFEGESERPRSGTVTAITDGYLDDSMRGEWCRFTMDRGEDGTWRVTEFRHAWRCYKGRVNEAGETRTDHLERFTSDRCL